ncbi:hypothetical protein Ddc_07429 [Ditylenchus destructor]|nr:hypothetical protein Ddc_07429 [Ditylenchus destructor]
MEPIASPISEPCSPRNVSVESRCRPHPFFSSYQLRLASRTSHHHNRFVSCWRRSAPPAPPSSHTKTTTMAQQSNNGDSTAPSPAEKAES